MTDISRRTALTAMGTVSLGALLAACGGGSDEPVTTTSVPTEGGATATIEPQTDGGGISSLFDDAPTCTLTPEQTEGPFYFDVDAIRSDIREDRDGTALTLGLRVQEAAACTPIGNAVVDVWHCDAGGLYSGFETASQGGPATGGLTDEETYLRGAQVTDADGIARFRTIYPGWYPGRTVHIHAKVHLDRTTVLTTQFYFPDDVSDAAFGASPYVERGARSTANEGDGIFDASTVLDVRSEGGGYLGLITVTVDR